MRTPRTNVPFLLPRSSIDTSRPVTVTRAWCLETFGESRRIAYPGFASHDVLAVAETELAARGRRASTRAIGGLRRAVRRGPACPTTTPAGREPIAESVHGLQESVGPRVVVDRVTDLAHRSGKARVRHEYARPDLVEQLLLRERARTVLDEDLQQLEGLRRQMHLLAAANELARVGVEVVVSKPNAHLGLSLSGAQLSAISFQLASGSSTVGRPRPQLNNAARAPAHGHHQE